MIRDGLQTLVLLLIALLLLIAINSATLSGREKGKIFPDLAETGEQILDNYQICQLLNRLN